MKAPMKPKSLICTMISLSAILVLPNFAEAKPASDKIESQPMVSHWRWTEEKWNGDELGYQKLRATIDNNREVGKLTLEALEKYKVLYEKKPEDPLGLFQWTYASFQATQSNPPIIQKQIITPYIFDKVTSPRTYEYDRLRFLVAVHYSPDSHLQGIGERLLQHTPDDYDVEYYLIQCYKPEHSSLEMQKAISLAQDLIKSAPQRPGSYSALGGIYFRSWMLSHQIEDADKAVSAYQSYLRLAPQNYMWREQAKNIIHYITSRSAAQK
jgi:tetratricopeptide (TPR) repeat protein